MSWSSEIIHTAEENQTPETKQFGEARPSSSCRLVQIFWRNPPLLIQSSRRCIHLKVRKRF